MSDVELTVVVEEDKLPELTSRVDCCAFCLVRQPDGKYWLRVERAISVHGPPQVDVAGLTWGDQSLEDRPPR